LKFMTKTQLFNLLTEGKFPEDRMLFRPILMHFAARFAGKTYGEFASNYKTLVECNIRTMDFFDPDLVGLISDPYRETSAFGAKVRFIDEGVPVCEELIVNNLHDVKMLRNPDVYKSERTLDRIKGAELFQQKLKGDVPVIGWIEGPLAEACDLAGVSNMLIFLMTDPDFCHLLMDKCVVTAKDFAKAQIEAGCQIIGIGDAICSQIDAFTYGTYVKDRHMEIIEFIHAQGGKVKLHICGNITHLLPSISELKADILDLDYQVDPEEAYRIVGPEVIRCGNINPVLIEEKPATLIFDAAKQLVEREKNRKFILSAGCEITVNTRHENLMAMRNASIF
jgi:MtaA/CmuA family methyltransferase